MLIFQQQKSGFLVTVCLEKVRLIVILGIEDTLGINNHSAYSKQ